MCAYNERETLGLEGVSFHLTCTNRTKVGREMGSRLGAGNEPHNGPRTDALAMSSNQKSSVRDRKHRHAHSTQNTVGKKKKEEEEEDDEDCAVRCGRVSDRVTWPAASRAGITLTIQGEKTKEKKKKSHAPSRVAVVSCRRRLGLVTVTESALFIPFPYVTRFSSSLFDNGST